MSGSNETAPKKTLTLGKKLELKKDSDQVRQSFSHGRSKAVTVEVKKRRTAAHAPEEQQSQEIPTEQNMLEPTAPAVVEPVQQQEPVRKLTEAELEVRMSALKQAQQAAKEVVPSAHQDEEEVTNLTELEAESLPHLEADEQPLTVNDFPRPVVETPRVSPKPVVTSSKSDLYDDEESDESSRHKRPSSAKPVEQKRPAAAPPPPTTRREAPQQPRKLSRHGISRALNDESDVRTRSMASVRRARQKHKSLNANLQGDAARVVRDVVVSDFITVGELANSMAVRSAEVVKSLMKLGMMVTVNQAIDADTAELIITEFGHNFKRVSDADVEIGLKGIDDTDAQLLPRAPVVTVMGHVDHGKTSLLDALRRTDVVAGEAGGITQHIGAYQVHLASGAAITFIDTPGHAAFTEMRARGANITDIVVLVVAADDGIMEQTVEAINHAKAANVPIVVAINKIDKPDANPDRVRNELLQHGIVLEEYGGDVLSVEVSAKKGLNLDKLEEAILLQAEILNLRANPNRSAEGAVIEARMDKGRGIVSTVLITRGTLRLGDILVAGTECGRVRAIVNDHGQKITEATPGMPIEILGFDGVPMAGDEMFIVEEESRAREISQYRKQRAREAKAAANAKGSMEWMMSQIAAGQRKEVGVVVKTDVHGSLEAISTSLQKLANDEISVRILHGGVGAISESDVTLANASNAVIIGFNVRAVPQALDLARKEKIDIRYYSIIYQIIDDMKVIMGGMLTPTMHEKYLGTAEIREVFSVPKAGRVAGCYITDGMVKRGSMVRLLRDNVVIHEGSLKTLRRFKDEVKEVKESYECGMAFENYNDIQVGDTIECFEMESQARTL